VAVFVFPSIEVNGVWRQECGKNVRNAEKNCDGTLLALMFTAANGLTPLGVSADWSRTVAETAVR